MISPNAPGPGVSDPAKAPVLPRFVRILVVDDDAQATALVELALMGAPFEYSASVVATASAGTRAIAADAHDIYLIDQQLPDGTGIEVIRKAKADGIAKPFILMTGYGSGALDEAALRGGAADYVEKHMLDTQLQRSIRYALRDWNTTRLLHDRDEQLRQAQKMEAIGRLAGGVAHDFNNLLTAIIGYADLVAERVPPNGDAARDINEIRKAADRAAALTGQLLAFSRKQFLTPSVLNLNETAADLLQMLPRVIGEHIRTRTRLATGLLRVRADASQMEQVLINLVLNARDAMPHGGDVIIETANVDLDDGRIASEHLRIGPGTYVMLSVADTGSGMDASTRAHAFEPFFTTKPKGKGTGLGLATVDGIIEQSGGGLFLESEIGRGTVIRIYLPATSARPEPVQEETARAHEGRGTETVLLVEDDESVRDLAARALRRRGYHVHEASSGDAAMDYIARTGIKPNLLVTDVLMPGLSGPNLAARLIERYPALHVLYMSGYADDTTGVQDALWNEVPLLQKPFSPARLAEHVRLALDTTLRRA